MSRTQSPARGIKDNLHGRLIFDLGETRKNRQNYIWG